MMKQKEQQQAAAPAGAGRMDGASVSPAAAVASLRHVDGSQRGFFRGEHLTLRPVLKDDLGGLAMLLAEDPMPRGAGPWTRARLLKEFEDKKRPGMWRDSELRWFVGVDHDGAVQAYVREQGYGPGIYAVQHWVAEGLSQRDAAGIELVALHLGWLTGWHAAKVVDTRFVASRADQLTWVEPAGFQPDFFGPRFHWYLGELQDVQHFTWLCDELRGQSPHSVGEPASSVEVEGILDW